MESQCARAYCACARGRRPQRKPVRLRRRRLHDRMDRWKHETYIVAGDTLLSSLDWHAEEDSLTAPTQAKPATRISSCRVAESLAAAGIPALRHVCGVSQRAAVTTTLGAVVFRRVVS
jgi:hypothetical protein